MYAVVVSAGRAGALQLRSHRRLVFVIEPVLKGEAEGPALPNQKQSYASCHIE